MTFRAQLPTRAADLITVATQESGRGLLDGAGSPCQAAKSLALRLSRPDCWGSPGNDSCHFPQNSGECQATRISVRSPILSMFAGGKGQAGMLNVWG